MDKKTMKRISRLKPTEELTMNLNGNEIQLMCLEKHQYLIFTEDSFYEINYTELIKKYQ